MSNSDLSEEHTRLILDDTKIDWHAERVLAWQRGEKVAPVTIDMALTRACNAACGFCYAVTQENDRGAITKDVMEKFLDDCKELDVKGISLVSDGESTLSPAFVYTIQKGHANGISMAVGSNGYLLDENKIREILPCLTYFRFNISAGEPERYKQVMGVRDGFFERVIQNIETMVKVKKELGLKVTIGLQMVLMPRDIDQVLPLARLGKKLRPDYLIVKHCSDTEDGALGVDYGAYAQHYGILEEAEALSDDEYHVHIKWNKINMNGKRSYSKCLGSPFLMQISGSGLVGPCGMVFNDRYKKLHLGSIVTERFKDIVYSERYREVMDYLASDDFNAKTMCGSLCLQDRVNTRLDNLAKAGQKIAAPGGSPPEHLNFV